MKRSDKACVLVIASGLLWNWPSMVMNALAATPQSTVGGKRDELRALHGSACTVKDIHSLIIGAGPDWSKSGNLIAYMSKDSREVYQIYAVRPDGTQNHCLTCGSPPGGPPDHVHKGSPSWDPSGRYILFQSEMSHHLGPHWPCEPGRGWWSNLWVMTPDGREFHELTGYSPFKATGVLVPRFSPDGKRILWTELIAGPKDKKVQSGPFGRWQINIADFVMEGPTPKLSNIRPMTPGNGIFYEVQDWSPDGRKILFASDIGRTSVMVVDLFSYDLRSARPTNLTDTDDQWEEQGAFSPDGRKIVYMSSRGAPGFDPRNIQTLRTEDFLMNADGSNSAQLTHFNTTGYPEYDRESSAATKAAWSPSGSQLVVEQQMMGKSYNKAKSRLHLLTFVGACGAQ